jgi:predicted nuclease with TOPRIM domain
MLKSLKIISKRFSNEWKEMIKARALLLEALNNKEAQLKAMDQEVRRLQLDKDRLCYDKIQLEHDLMVARLESIGLKNSLEPEDPFSTWDG